MSNDNYIDGEPAQVAFRPISFNTQLTQNQYTKLQRKQYINSITFPYGGQYAAINELEIFDR